MNNKHKDCFKNIICTYNTSLLYIASWVLSFPFIYLTFYNHFSFGVMVALSIGFGHLILNILLLKLCRDMDIKKRPYTSVFWGYFDTIRILILIVFLLYYGTRFS